MKLSINCGSLLLQKSLENFLKKYIVSRARADFIISDKPTNSDKPIFVIGKDIEKPFSRSRLFMELEKFEKQLQTIDAVAKIDKELTQTPQGLEEEVEALTKEFVSRIVQTFKKYNGKND